MWSLIRKNLWLWRPGLSANAALFLAALAFSLGDAMWRFPPSGWMFCLAFMFLLGQAGGASTLGIDLKDDNIRFLEYLPVRWSQVWLANWLDGLLTSAVIIGLLVWHRVLFWSPQEPLRPYEAQLHLSLFGTRWSILIQATVVLFFSFSYTLFWRTFFRSDNAALIPTWVGSVVYLMVPAVILPLMQLTPSLLDLAPMLLLVGGLFSLGSLTAFAAPPYHWSRLRRFLCVGIPLALLIVALEAAALAVACGRWAQLDWHERGLSYHCELVRSPSASAPRGPSSAPSALAPSSELGLIVTAASDRSGPHALYYDLATEKSCYLGRGMQVLNSDPSVGAGGRLIVQEQNPFRGFRPQWEPRFLTMRPDGTDRRPLLRGEWLSDGEGRDYSPTAAQWARDGAHLLVFAIEEAARKRGRSSLDDDQPSRARLFVLTADGRVRQSLPVRGASSFLSARNGRILAAPPEAPGTTASADDDSSDDPKDPAPATSPSPAPAGHRLYEPQADRTSELSLPGQVLRFSKDLKRAFCVRSEVRGGWRHRWLVVVDLDSRQERVLIPEKDMVPTSEGDARDRYTPADLLQQSDEAAVSLWTQPALAWDPSEQQAVWLAQRLDGSTQRLRLVHLDLATGRQRVLVPESELPAMDMMTGRSLYDNGLALWGFTGDGQAFVYQVKRRMTHVNLSDGTRQTTALPEEEHSYGSPSFSPSRRRWLVWYYLPEKDRDYRRPMAQVTEVMQAGGPALLKHPSTSADRATLQWLDEDHLVCTQGEKVWIMNADGTGKRQLLPPPSSAR